MAGNAGGEGIWGEEDGGGSLGEGVEASPGKRGLGSSEKGNNID